MTLSAVPHSDTASPSQTFEVWTRDPAGKQVLRFRSAEIDEARAAAIALMDTGGGMLPHAAFYEDVLVKYVHGMRPDGRKDSDVVGHWDWVGPQETWECREAIPAG